MWAGQGEYPSITLMVTDNPKYADGRMVRRTRAAVLKEVERWLATKAEYIP